MAISTSDADKPVFPAEANSAAYAKSLDSKAFSLRDQFIIPSKRDLTRKQLKEAQQSDKPTEAEQEPCTYLCGNSLGLQPRVLSDYLQVHLNTWAHLGVYGHFTSLEDSPLQSWQNMGSFAAEQSAKIVGALPAEVAVMQTLTANLHLLLASFYRPTPTRNKILMDWKAFPSDHVWSFPRYRF